MKVAKLDLRLEVEKKFGKRILSSSDCRLLSEDILKQIHVNLSFNTVRRFFNLMHSNSDPSITTLNLLSKYCGYSSYSDFSVVKQHESENANDAHVDLLNYLILIFEKTHISSAEDKTFTSLVFETINYLEKYPALIDTFQRQIAKTNNGRHFYFEKFFSLDHLDSHYGDGLYYYLSESNSVPSKLFAHALLCLRNWLTMNDAAVKKHYGEVMKCNINKVEHPFVCGSYFATKLYYADVCGTDTELILKEAKQFYISTFKGERLFYAFPYFEFLMAETLVLTHHYDEALYYIDETLQKRNAFTVEHIHGQLVESVYLALAIVFLNLDRRDEARQIFKTINTSNFYFLSKKFNSILYLQLQRSFYKAPNAGLQLQHLISETGFTRLLMLHSSRVVQMKNDDTINAEPSQFGQNWAQCS